MRIHAIQHVPFESAGAILDWAQERGHSFAVCEQFSGAQLPRVEEFDFLVIMGGPMSANDDLELPWLGSEKKLIEEALGAQKAILGICLGAQLIASVLGSRVYKNGHKEIGWFPIRTTPEARESKLLGGVPASITVLHWHGETFDLPEGAMRLAESDACRNQAFEFDGRVLGLQFHLEVPRSGLEKLIQNCGADIDGGPFVQSPDEMLANAHLSQMLQPLLYSILDRMAEKAPAGEESSQTVSKRLAKSHSAAFEL